MSTSRIKTTHTGSLPRPPTLTTLLREQEEGRLTDGLDVLASQAVVDVVHEQLEHGLDVVNDGEQTKASYATYVKYRLGGFEGSRESAPVTPSDEFPDLPNLNAGLASRNTAYFPTCVSPILLKDPAATRHDIERLKASASRARRDAADLFLTAASPGLVARSFRNDFYKDRESYLSAVGDAMRDEYRSIVNAGIILQLDCPDFASTYGPRYREITVDDFRREVAQSVEALNAAVAGLPSERMRLHVCWGNYEGPHNHDIELRDIIDIVLMALPAGISLEASNPRHGHEWRVFEDVQLPDGKYVIPGVIDTTTNFIEHPELVAQRLWRYTSLLGNERVMAGTDCGFATFVGPRRVAPSVAWAKLDALVAGARLAEQSTP